MQNIFIREGCGVKLIESGDTCKNGDCGMGIADAMGIRVGLKTDARTKKTC